jgi:hypothetical protein
MLTGLGACEMDLLWAFEEGSIEPQAALSAATIHETFNEQEAGELLYQMAGCQAPAIFELDQPPRDVSEQASEFQYRGGRIALTELGRAVAAFEDDFSRHNPIQRWWGGTELTSDRLWRWDAESRSLVAP